MYKKKLKTSRAIGEKIKGRRRELGISQESLAEILGVTYQQVQRYENGTNKLNVENIQTVADAINVPVSYFFEDERVLMVAEKSAPYLPSDEVKLLRHFRKLKSSASKKTVIQVARLAAKAN
ncbi:MAG: helix-turn-helix transcriptional regulator [Thermodesulfovibrionales bacterium]|nr:helix-turn-helix transcriptional regulator [Thermodesulfovibrionales bacterium]